MRRCIASIVALGVICALAAVADDSGEGGASSSGESSAGGEGPRPETATFAMGCFWGPDGLFGVLPGVIRTRVGYAGGTTETPTYHDLGGAAEAVEVDFDPSAIGYDELLSVFWANHAPFGLAYNGQYRSEIFVRNEEQRRLAEASWQAVSGRTPTTKITVLERFTRAEDDHQKFRLQNEEELFEEIRDRFATFRGFVDSTLAARVNGFLGGHGTREQLEQEIAWFGLSPEAQATLRSASFFDAATCPVP